MGEKDNLITLGAVLGKLAGGDVIPSYIGGNKQESRNKYWQQNPIIVNAVDSIAKRYDLNTDLLLERLTQEGFVDEEIKAINKAYHDKKPINLAKRQKDVLNGQDYNGFAHFGLDYVPDLIYQDIVAPINEEFYTGEGINEQGQTVYPAFGNTVLDNMGLVAATLSGLRDEAKKHYKNATSSQLDEYANIFYNRGINAGRKSIKNNVKGYKIPTRMRSLKLGGKNK